MTGDAAVPAHGCSALLHTVWPTCAASARVPSTPSGGWAAWPKLDANEYAEIDARIDAERLYPRLERALARLSPGDRDLLLLVEREGLKPSEAARALGIRPVTARVRLLRARRKLHAELAGRVERALPRRAI